MGAVVRGLAVAAVLWVAAIQVDPAARRPGLAEEELFYYPSGRFLKEASLGYEQAGAALTWLRTVQYYGKHVRSDKQFQMMYHLCDIVTDLDPQFEEPYVFGSFVLFTDKQDPVEGVKLLNKGRANNPESWRIYFESGFLHYTFLRDYEHSSRFLQKAAELPGSPPYAASFAAFVSQKAGSLEASLLMWSEFADRTDNPALYDKAMEKIEEIKAELAAQPGGDR